MKKVGGSASCSIGRTKDFNEVSCVKKINFVDVFELISILHNFVISVFQVSIVVQYTTDSCSEFSHF